MAFETIGLAAYLLLLAQTGKVGPPWAADAERVCPPRIDVQETPTGLADEWKWERRGVQHRLVGVDVFEVIEGTRAVLAPAQEDGLRSEYVNVWRLPAAGTHGVTCLYENSGVVLVKMLPAGVTECRARIGEKPTICGRSEVLDVTCGAQRRSNPLPVHGERVR